MGTDTLHHAVYAGASGFAYDLPSHVKGSLMAANSYATFLILGVLIILVDGQILYRGGLGYLRKVYANDSGRSVMQLVSVLFHLTVLGALALISMVNVSTGLPVRDLVVKLGVVLL